MGVQQLNIFTIETIQLKKFDFEQTGALREESEIGIHQKIGAIAKKESANRYFIQLDINLSSKQEDLEVFRIQAAIISIIEVSDNFEETLLSNMVAIMYSYLRPMVAQMTVMAKLPPLDLPPVSFEEFEVKIVNDKQSSTADSNKDD